jgi:hypothetical protein
VATALRRILRAAVGLGVQPDLRIKRLRRMVPQLLLPGEDLVHELGGCAKSFTVACSRNASSAIFAFSPARVFRRVFDMLRSKPFGADFLKPSQGP